MRIKGLITASAWIAILLAVAGSCIASPGSGLLSGLGFPEPPDAKLLTEINLPRSRVADLESQYAPQLGLRSMKQVMMVEYNISSFSDAQTILGSYDPYIKKQGWNTVTSVVKQGVGIAILSNDKLGVLIILVDPPTERDRSLSFLRIVGEMDPMKKVDPGKLASFIPEVSKQSGIPANSQLSVPPSTKLDLKVTKSAIKARLLPQNTVQINMMSRDNAGSMSRADDVLVLELAPRLPIDGIDLPANVALLVELIEGSLSLTGSPGAAPSRLNVVATGAPVELDQVPLVSGTHSIKSVNGEVKVSLSPVEGGTFGVDVTGADVTILVPKNASATVKASTTSGKIQNMTGVKPDASTDSSMTLKLGAGKANIALKAVNGIVYIKFAN